MRLFAALLTACVGLSVQAEERLTLPSGTEVERAWPNLIRFKDGEDVALALTYRTAEPIAGDPAVPENLEKLATDADKVCVEHSPTVIEDFTTRQPDVTVTHFAVMFEWEVEGALQGWRTIYKLTNGRCTPDQRL